MGEEEEGWSVVVMGGCEKMWTKEKQERLKKMKKMNQMKGTGRSLQEREVVEGGGGGRLRGEGRKKAREKIRARATRVLPQVST